MTIRFAIGWTLTETLGTTMIFGSLARLDTQLSKQALDRQEHFAGYRTAGVAQ